MPFRLTSQKVKLSEKDVTAACIDYLKARGYWVKRNPVGHYIHAVSGNHASFGPPGIPDYLAAHELYPMFFIEFKRPGKYLRVTQMTQFQVIQFGFHLAAVMVDSLDELIVWLNGYEARVREKWLKQCPQNENAPVPERIS